MSNACPCAGKQSSADSRATAATTETAEFLLLDLYVRASLCPAIERAFLNTPAHQRREIIPVHHAHNNAIMVKLAKQIRELNVSFIQTILWTTSDHVNPPFKPSSNCFSHKSTSPAPNCSSFLNSACYAFLFTGDS
jgi:hypothetical protein